LSGVLLGIREGSALAGWFGALPDRPRRKTVAHARETFFQAAYEPYELVVLHTELVSDLYPWEWIGRLRELQPRAEIVVVPSEAAYDSLWLEVMNRLAAEAGFAVAPLGAGAEELAASLSKAGDGSGGVAGHAERTGIVAALWPAAPKDGATTVAVGVALTLARQAPSLSVGLLDLNLKNPELRVALREGNWDRTNASLRPKLQTGALTPEELSRACAPVRKAPNVRVLYGTHRRDTACDVSPEMMETLLSVARRTFDVTILDTSSYPDNAATVCGVRGADVRWLVASNRSPSYLWSWSEWYECYWKHCGLSASGVELVCNRFDPSGEPAEAAAASIGMSLAGSLPDVPGDAGAQAAETGRPLLDDPRATEFASAVYRLASRLHVASGREPFPDRADARRRTGLVSLLSGLF